MDTMNTFNRKKSLHFDILFKLKHDQICCVQVNEAILKFLTTIGLKMGATIIQ